MSDIVNPYGCGPEPIGPRRANTCAARGCGRTIGMGVFFCPEHAQRLPLPVHADLGAAFCAIDTARGKAAVTAAVTRFRRVRDDAVAFLAGGVP